MRVVEDEVADDGGGDEARERQDVGDGVDVFVGGELGEGFGDSSFEGFEDFFGRGRRRACSADCQYGCEVMNVM